MDKSNSDLINSEFVTNLSLHCIILFTFLSIFFVYYISGISENKLQGELTKNINGALNSALSNYPNQSVLTQTLQSLPYTSINNLYAGPDPVRTVNNYWLFRVILIVNIGLWLLFITIVSLSKYYFDKDINISKIAKENAIVFTGIGIIEFVFLLLYSFYQ